MKNDSISLSVIIPFYDETPEEIYPLLNSLNMQIGIDESRIEHILVNDGIHNTLPEDFLNRFDKLNLRIIYMDENRGPGVARQMGVDSAMGDYVTFCDADDVLQNVHVINSYLQGIDIYKPDVLASTWLNERYDEKEQKFSYIIHDSDETWLHGKLYNRAFLSLNDIRFHEKLRVHEDTYFNRLAFSLAKEAYKVVFTSYVWRSRPNSITRRNDSAYSFESMPEFLYSLGLACEKLEEMCPDKVESLVVRTIIHTFFILHQRDWISPDKEKLLKKAESAFRDIINPLFHYYEQASPETVIALYNEERGPNFLKEIETETIADWLKRLRIQSFME